MQITQKRFKQPFHSMECQRFFFFFSSSPPPLFLLSKLQAISLIFIQPLLRYRCSRFTWSRNVEPPRPLSDFVVQGTKLSLPSIHLRHSCATFSSRILRRVFYVLATELPLKDENCGCNCSRGNLSRKQFQKKFQLGLSMAVNRSLFITNYISLPCSFNRGLLFYFSIFSTFSSFLKIIRWILIVYSFSRI